MCRPQRAVRSKIRQAVRRSGTLRNCLFLATKDETLIQAAALIDLWAEGYVEPIEPPPLPFHVLAHQLMALTLQEIGIGRAVWFSWVGTVPGFAEIPPEKIERLVDSMLERGQEMGTGKKWGRVSIA